MYSLGVHGRGRGSDGVLVALLGGTGPLWLPSTGLLEIGDSAPFIRSTPLQEKTKNSGTRTKACISGLMSLNCPTVIGGWQ